MDAVAHAAQTPDDPQPFAELGLKPDEYQRIRDCIVLTLDDAAEVVGCGATRPRPGVDHAGPLPAARYGPSRYGATHFFEQRV